MARDYRTYRATVGGRAVHLLSCAKKRAKDKGLEFTLTTEWLEEKLVNGYCEVTGISLDYMSGIKQGCGRAFGPSLDRKDPRQGYTPENTQLVCWIYNRSKGVGSHEEVVTLAEALCKKIA